MDSGGELSAVPRINGSLPRRYRPTTHRTTGQDREGIRPEIIAGKINESLRQQFVQTTIPQTAEALAVISQCCATAGPNSARRRLHLARLTAGRCMRPRRPSCNRESANRAREAASKLLTTYQGEYRWSVLLLTGCSLVAGTSLGRFSITGLSIDRRCCMLTIRAMADGKGYSARHLENSDYYAEGERVKGRWCGRGAELLGLQGDVRQETSRR